MKVVVCSDDSEYGDRAVKYAARFAQRFGIDLTIMYVIEGIVSSEELPSYPGFKPKREKAEAIVSRAKELVETISKDIQCHKKIVHGPISSEIVRIAEVEKFDGIIMGTKGARGLRRMLLGSVADDVIRHAHCPVTVVR